MVTTHPGRFYFVLLVMAISLIISIGGSVFLSLSVAHNTKESICNGFAYFIHKPTAPPGTALYRREVVNYRNLQIFNRKIGCS